MDELIRLRHELHRNPELSGQERATGKRLRFFLNKYKPDELYTGIAGEGMAAVYHGSEPGPTVLFRCDIDALPIQETTKSPYSSKVPGVSHACGHDGHMTIVSGLASDLSTYRIKKGKAILFYQPEEENGQGASKSIKRLKELNLFPDLSFAIHNMPKHPLGSVIIGEHTFASASKGLIFKLIGKASHAAYPEKGINPSMAISEIIQELNGLTKEKIFSSFVLLTIIHIRVGEIAFGTSPGYGEIMVTLRSFANADMEILSQKAIDITRTIGTKYGLMVETSVTDDYPAANCDKELTNLIKSIAIEQNREVVVLKEPNRWSEDFSNFTLHGQSIIFGLGVGESVPDLHSPDYDFPDAAIEHGIEILKAVANKYLM